jgi:hypothetical protein
MDMKWLFKKGMVRKVGKKEAYYFDGNLEIKNHQYIIFPDDLEVNGDITIKNGGDISFPDKLVVRGELHIDSCGVIKNPKMLKVESLRLKKCNIDSLGENSLVSENIYLSNCSNLKELPSKLKNVHEIFIQECNSLVGLPRELKSIKYNLRVVNCDSFSFIPEGLKIGMDLSLRFLREFTVFPKNISVNISLDLCGLPFLKVLGDGLKIGASVDIRECINLRELPSFKLREDYNVSGCPSLKKIGGSEVGGLMTLEKCPSLEEITSPIKAYDLTISCPKLKVLPDNCVVKRDMDLSGCYSLESLPSGLRVGESLNVCECVSLCNIPTDLFVGSDMNLMGCVSLKYLPSEIDVKEVAIEGCTIHALKNPKFEVGGVHKIISNSLQFFESLEA